MDKDQRYITQASVVAAGFRTNLQECFDAITDRSNGNIRAIKILLEELESRGFIRKLAEKIALKADLDVSNDVPDEAIRIMCDAVCDGIEEIINAFEGDEFVLEYFLNQPFKICL